MLRKRAYGFLLVSLLLILSTPLYGLDVAQELAEILRGLETGLTKVEAGLTQSETALTKVESGLISVRKGLEISEKALTALTVSYDAYKDRTERTIRRQWIVMGALGIVALWGVIR